jgi:molybdenum cofactor biosynthesis enzyme MoaA
MKIMKNTTYVRFLISSDCQSNCIFCHKDGVNTKKIFLSFSKFKEIINNYEKQIKKIRFSGGEPLLNKQIFKMTDFCRSITNNVCIVTNGLLLDNYKAKIKKDKYPNLTVSIHSLYFKTFNKITGLNSNQHKKIINTIKELSPYTNIKINIVFLKDLNITDCELKKIIDFGVKYNLNIRFQELDLGSISSDFSIDKYHYPIKNLIKDIEQIYPIKFKKKKGISTWVSGIDNSEISIRGALCFNKKCKECDLTRPLLIKPDGVLTKCRLCNN